MTSVVAVAVAVSRTSLTTVSFGSYVSFGFAYFSLLGFLAFFFCSGEIAITYKVGVPCESFL